MLGLVSFNEWKDKDNKHNKNIAIATINNNA